MDYEKKYKEALERARVWKEKSGMPADKQGILDDIFPELAGSEDEKVRKALVEMVHNTTGDELWVDYNVHKEEALTWLEKQGEQKPAEWSKEDERLLNNMIIVIQDYYNKEDAQSLISWLKSLKDRYTWKPSNEQMESLWCATEKYLESDNVNVVELRGKVLESLYNDLKKLREE